MEMQSLAAGRKKYEQMKAHHLSVCDYVGGQKGVKLQ